MHDVALRANVSAMTVSRYLRSPDLVSLQTRQAVSAAIQETGYVHNWLASSLASSRSRVVAAIIPSITHSSLEPMIERLMRTLQSSGLHLLLAPSGETKAQEAVTIEAMLAQRPCALLLHNTRHSAAARAVMMKAGIPLVECGDLLRAPLDLCVSFSNRAAAKAMTLHLAAQGYQRIAIATVESRTNDRSLQRLAGYRDGLCEAGLQPAKEFVLETHNGFDGGKAVSHRIVDDKIDADALFCATGILALGALYGFKQRGWAVPERIGVAGFDDNELMQAAEPSLTTIRVPRATIGEMAAAAILESLAGSRTATAITDVGFELVERSSTRRVGEQLRFPAGNQPPAD